MLFKKVRLSSKNDKILLGIFIFVFITILVLTALTPMLADDYSYSFSFADRSRISSLGDIFRSLQAHRVDINGRMLAHFFAHLFLLLPKPVFCLLNAVVFTLILGMIIHIAGATDSKYKIYLSLIALSLIWLYTPVFGQVYLWLDGACNYSWGLCFILAFLLPYFCTYLYNKNNIFSSIPKKLLFLLLAFMAGSYSEGASFAMLFIAFCLIVCLWYRDKKAPVFLIISLVFACFGYLFLMTAPSEWSGRTGSFSIEVIAKNIKRIISAPEETMLPLFVLYGVLLAACIKLKVRKEAIVCSIILFLGAWMSIILFAVALYFPWRSLLMMSLMLITACILMLSQLCPLVHSTILPVFTAGLSVLFIFQYILGVGDIGFVFVQYKQREAAIAQAIASGSDSVYLDVYDADTKYSGAYLLADIYDDCWIWPNYDLEAYYGIDRIYGVGDSNS
jgi:hypothetical protein